MPCLVMSGSSNVESVASWISSTELPGDYGGGWDGLPELSAETGS